jgi:hypothetical protein
VAAAEAIQGSTMGTEQSMSSPSEETSLDSVSGSISATMFSVTWDTTTTQVTGSSTIISVLSAQMSRNSTINGLERAENGFVATFLVEPFFTDFLAEST